MANSTSPSWILPHCCAGWPGKSSFIRTRLPKSRVGGSSSHIRKLKPRPLAFLVRTTSWVFSAGFWGRERERGGGSAVTRGWNIRGWNTEVRSLREQLDKYVIFTQYCNKAQTNCYSNQREAVHVNQILTPELDNTRYKPTNNTLLMLLGLKKTSIAWHATFLPLERHHTQWDQQLAWQQELAHSSYWVSKDWWQREVGWNKTQLERTGH